MTVTPPLLIARHPPTALPSRLTDRQRFSLEPGRASNRPDSGPLFASASLDLFPQRAYRVVEVEVAAVAVDFNPPCSLP